MLVERAYMEDLKVLRMHSISKPFAFFCGFLFEICVDRDLKMSNVYNAVAVRSREEVLFHL